MGGILLFIKREGKGSVFKTPQFSTDFYVRSILLARIVI